MFRDLCLCYAIQKIHNFSFNKDFVLREFYSQLIFCFSTCVQHLPKRKSSSWAYASYIFWVRLSFSVLPMASAPCWPWKHTTRLFAPYWCKAWAATDLQRGLLFSQLCPPFGWPAASCSWTCSLQEWQPDPRGSDQQGRTAAAALAPQAGQWPCHLSLLVS